jgi:predicted nuclease of predicted toxin-antitoxin system
MIRFLADENVSKSLTIFLKKEGYDIKDIKEERLFGMPDDEILELAGKEERIILTHDKEFGDVLQNPLNYKGIIIIRYSNQSSDSVIKKFRLDLEKIKNKAKNSVIVLYDKYIDMYGLDFDTP